MGTTIEEKKEIIRKEVNKKKDGKYESLIDFRFELEKTLTDEEKKYIRDAKIQPYYFEITQKVFDKRIEDFKKFIK